MNPTAPREPGRLPDAFDSWEEWRIEYWTGRKLYIDGRLGPVAFQSLLATLGFSQSDMLKEMIEARQARELVK